MKAVYFKKLDSLRFIAFFLVFWQHGFSHSLTQLSFIDKKYIQPLTLTGGIGVHIFFVISGFLITYLLLKEQQKAKKINIKNFYIRRILRIWPLYYFVIGLGIFVLPHIASAFCFCGSKLLNLTFLNNFNININNCDCPNIGIAWSVAIEEQFYLFWPLIFSLLIKSKRVLYFVCAGIYLASSIFILESDGLSYYHTLGNLNYLMAGCMGAIVYTQYAAKINNGYIMRKRVLAGIVLATTALILFKPAGYFFIMPFLYLYLVVYTIATDSKKQKTNLFSWLGKYTYGMYMYHLLFIIGLRIAFDLLAWDYKENGLINFALAAIAMALTIGGSILSYEFVEKRFLKYKSRLSAIKTRI